MILREANLEIDFSNAEDGIVFDNTKPGPGFCHDIPELKRVDFIVELAADIYFVEVKDPSHPQATDRCIEDFNRKVANGDLAMSLAGKFIHSFLFRWAEDQLSKSVHYLNLITLDTELLPNLGDEIARNIPTYGKNSVRWARTPIKSCYVFNLETWNKTFPSWPVRRITMDIS